MKQMRKAFSTGLTVAEIASTTRCIARRDQLRAPHDRQDDAKITQDDAKITMPSSTRTLEDGADGGGAGCLEALEPREEQHDLENAEKAHNLPARPRVTPRATSAAAALQRCSIAATQHRSAAAVQHRRRLGGWAGLDREGELVVVAHHLSRVARRPHHPRVHRRKHRRALRHRPPPAPAPRPPARPAPPPAALSNTPGG